VGIVHKNTKIAIQKWGWGRRVEIWGYVYLLMPNIKKYKKIIIFVK
jgi:hypothetical protein